MKYEGDRVSNPHGFNIFWKYISKVWVFSLLVFGQNMRDFVAIYLLARQFKIKSRN